MCLPLETNDHHKDCLTCSGGTDRSGKPCYNLSLSDDLTQVVNFATRIPRLRFSQFCLFGFRRNLMLLFVLQWLSLHYEILIMLLFQFPLTFHRVAYDYSRSDWYGFV